MCNISFAEKSSGNVTNNSKSLAAGDSLPTSLSQSDILAASNSVKSYINKNGKLPDYVTIANNKFSMSEFLYLSSKTISYKYSGSNSKVQINYNVKDPKSPNGNSLNMKISKKDYYNLAKNVANFIDKNNIAPNYASSSSKKIQYQTLVYGFSSILSYSYNNKALPVYLSLDFKSSSSLNKYIPKYIRSILSSSNLSKENVIYPYDIVSVDSILAASSSVETYIKTHGKLPNYVTINKKNYSMPEYLHSLTQAIGVYAKTGNPPNDFATINLNVKNPPNPSGSSIHTNLNFHDFHDISGRIATYITKNNMIPNYVSSKYGNIQYQTAIYALTKVVSYMNKNKVLPKFVSINVKSNSSINKYIPKL